MNILCYENIRPFDTDDCLIMHSFTALDDTIIVVDPYSNQPVRVRPNKNMVRLLKEESLRGGTVIVWSRGGYKWSEAVIRALDLEKYVTFIMSKPMIYYDDKEVAEWMQDRVYLGPDVNYKQTN
jgi:hypothetical protein